MRSVRLASLVFMGASLSLGVSACGNDSSSGSTTSPSAVAADATTSESFTTTVPVGYCIQVYDAGMLTEDTPFSLTVEHP
jgi:hypothetical protein